MDSFKGHEKIKLMASKDRSVYDNNILFIFEHTVTTDTTTGFLPSGSVLSAVETTSYKISGGDLHEVDDLIVDSQLAPYNNNYVLVNLKFPLINGPGRYGIEFKLTFGSSVKSSYFGNVWCTEIDGEF